MPNAQRPVRIRNLGTRKDGGNRSRPQRVGAGKGEPAAGAGAAAAGAAPAFGAAGRFAGARLAARLVGVNGCNSAITGFGSTVVEAGVVKSPGFTMTATGIVTGWNFGAEKVTVKFGVDGIETEQGVLQPGPTEVTASAPGGSDSS